MTKTKTALVVSDPKLLAARTQGVRISAPLEELVSSLTITDEESYLEADSILSQIRHGRALWRTKMDPITSPLQRALDAAKEAMQGAKALYTEVDEPMATLELRIKYAMRDYKLLEARQIEEAKAEERREAERLRQEAAKKDLAAKSAVTTQMRARLEQARSNLIQQAEVVEDAVEDIKPTKAANSSDRWTEKCQIVDVWVFVMAMEHYLSTDNVYRMKAPPLSILKDPTVVKAMQVILNRIFADTPGVVKSWPGVTCFKDVVIAGR